MTTDLRDRLHDLADRTPVAPPPTDLWTRGVRRRRAARAGTTILVAALVVLLSVGGWAVHTAHQRIEPAGSQGTPHLPDRFYAPSPWLHAFGGPPGRLVAVGVAQRKSLLHTRTDAFGVTAAGGSYGFLDLSGLADRLDYASAVPPALSPDGRYVAFWVTGTPSASANTVLYGQTITGIAVYDATTDRVRTSRLPTEHGLAPLTLAWSDSRTLVAGVGQAMGGDQYEDHAYTSFRFRMMAWRLEDARPEPLPLPKGVDVSGNLTAGHGLVLASGDGNRFWLIWPRHPRRDHSIRARVGNAVTVAGPGATEVAAVVGNRNPNHLVVGTVASADNPTKEKPVNGDRDYYLPITWTDDRHVVALARNPDHGAATFSARLDLVNVRDGSSRVLVNHLPGGGNGWQGLSLATGLLTAPSARAVPPPRPWDRRGIAIGLVVGVLLVLLVGLTRLRGMRSRRA